MKRVYPISPNSKNNHVHELILVIIKYIQVPNSVHWVRKDFTIVFKPHMPTNGSYNKPFKIILAVPIPNLDYMLLVYEMSIKKRIIRCDFWPNRLGVMHHKLMWNDG